MIGLHAHESCARVGRTVRVEALFSLVERNLSPVHTDTTQRNATQPNWQLG